jgi:hypothetical protein
MKAKLRDNLYGLHDMATELGEFLRWTLAVD